MQHDQDSELSTISTQRQHFATSEEEKAKILALAKKASEGDKDAEKQLVIMHLWLVDYLVRRYLNRGLPYDDLYQEGCLGLIAAIRNFDYTRNLLLSTYASDYIIRDINRALIRNNIIPLPEYIHLQVSKYKYTKSILTTRLSRIPTDEEISDEMQVPLPEIKKLKKYMLRFSSLDNTSFPEQEKRASNCVSCNSASNPEPCTDDVSEIVFQKMELLDLGGLENLLTEREERILSLRFNGKEKNMTFREIAERVGGSSESVRMSYKKAIKKLTNHLNAGHFYS